MADKTIMRRLLEAIADSEHDHPGDDSYYVDLTRADAYDAVKRITELVMLVSKFATALHEIDPDHPLLKEEFKGDVAQG